MQNIRQYQVPLQKYISLMELQVGLRSFTVIEFRFDDDCCTLFAYGHHVQTNCLIIF